MVEPKKEQEDLLEEFRVDIPFPLPPEEPKELISCYITPEDQKLVLLPFGITNRTMNVFGREEVKRISQLLLILDGSQEFPELEEDCIQEAREGLKHFANWVLEEKEKHPDLPIIIDLPLHPPTVDEIVDFCRKWVKYEGDEQELIDAAKRYFRTTAVGVWLALEKSKQ